ncbi:MAG: competence/damage-inducible protein A [Lachnospiraceae bacterium]|nr:competence/damage-inducible protein A [Lachnospiraceae bacterium]
MFSKNNTVELLCVGTELLLGNIVNTNAAFLAEELAKMGLASYYQTVVGDNAERLEASLKLALSRSDIVILVGGLGPTEDDLTKEVASKVAGKKLFLHEESKNRIEDYFKKRGITLTDNNFKQALIPEGATVLTNNNGTAPGVIIPYEDKFMILLPGPPVELKPMFNESVVPFLQKISPVIFKSRTVKVVSVGESTAETMIKDMIDSQTNPTIATYAKTGEVHIRVTASGKDEEECESLIKPVIRELKKRFGNNIYTTHDEVSLEKAVVDLLLSGGLKITTVESCTAGMVASRIVNVSGASDVFKYSFVTYCDEAKHKLVGVKNSTLEKHTAVSRETAEEMVKSLDGPLKSDVCVGVTGYADGEDAGHVFIACNVRGKIEVREFHFVGNRLKVRESATTQALVLARDMVLKFLSEIAFS